MALKRFDVSQAYRLFLRTENVFKNPTMRLFCQILLEPAAENITTQDQIITKWGDLLEFTPTTYTKQQGKRKINRNRWFLAYTLIHNPQLKRLRGGIDKRNNNLKNDDKPDVAIA